MEIPVLIRSLKSSILSSTSFQTGNTFWGVVSAAVEQSRRKANMVARGEGILGPWGWPQDPSKPKKNKSLQVLAHPVGDLKLSRNRQLHYGSSAKAFTSEVRDPGFICNHDPKKQQPVFRALEDQWGPLKRLHCKDLTSPSSCCNRGKGEKNVYNFLSFQFLSAVVPEILS